jgi:hypothetical protein
MAEPVVPDSTNLTGGMISLLVSRQSPPSQETFAESAWCAWLPIYPSLPKNTGAIIVISREFRPVGIEAARHITWFHPAHLF